MTRSAKKLLGLVLAAVAIALPACGGETGPEPGGPAPVEELPST